MKLREQVAPHPASRNSCRLRSQKTTARVSPTVKWLIQTTMEARSYHCGAVARVAGRPAKDGLQPCADGVSPKPKPDVDA